MNRAEATRVLGVERGATREQVDSAKRELLKALHPDKHPYSQKELFERMTRDVIQAHGVLAEDDSEPSGSSSPDYSDADARVVETLYTDAGDTWEHASEAAGTSLQVYQQCYAVDPTLAIAVFGIDTEFVLEEPWQDSFRGSAVYFALLNRTAKRVDGIRPGQSSVLVDDRGHQYSPEDSVVKWIDGSGNVHRHCDMVAPGARLDGFMAFPPLRAGSRVFVRWFWATQFEIEGDWTDAEFDISLDSVAGGTTQ